MHVRLLGPLQVDDDGRDLLPTRPKQRALLAMLALHAGDVVAAESLVEALWGDDPPPTAANALQGHVAGLRKLMGPERIETGWWRQGLVRRDYYRIETDTGCRLWLFRDLTDGSWYLHGSFE